MSARDLAASVVRRVVDDGSFSQHALAAALERSQLDPRERARATDLTYGTLTWRLTIDALLNTLLPRGLDSLPPPARALLRVATFQLVYRCESTPAYAVVDETVTTARRWVGPKLASLTNAVLRNVERQRAAFFSSFEARPLPERFGLTHGLPEWMATMLLERLPEEEATRAMDAFNAATRTHLRVRQGSVAEAQEALRADGIESEPHPIVPNALVCTGGNPAATGAFARRQVAIQDAGAQLAALHFPPTLQGSVLDACAGLGGKALHLSDRYPAAHILCTDRHENKLAHVTRLSLPGTKVETSRWDLTDPAPPKVRGAGPYAAVILDAPCSGLGTLGRHPEVRWNRRPSDITGLAAVQDMMLDRVSELVAPGGWLLYVVCTWTHPEGAGQIRQWLERTPTFRSDPPTRETADPDVAWDTLVDEAGIITLWPHTSGTDGFLLARLRRTD